MKGTVRAIQYCLTALGVAALGYCAFVIVDAWLYQIVETRKFDQAVQVTPPAPAPARERETIPEPKDGEALGKLQIPRLGVSVMVVEGDGQRDLRLAAGHIPGTALPGVRGNIAIAGHRDTFFRSLRNIRLNDNIRLITAHGAYRYRVVSTQIVGPRDVRVLQPGRDDSLTLVTCYPFYYVGSAPKRFIVLAARLSG